MRSNACDERMSQCWDIGGEQRKSFINNVVLAAELPDLAVPSAAGIAAVLNECRYLTLSNHLLQMRKRNIADAEKACAACITLPLHRFPGFTVHIRPGMAGPR